MIKSLRIGDLWNVQSLIEIVNNEKMLLERVQTQPHYHNEELAFDMEGRLLEIKCEKDAAIDPNPYKYPRLRFGIQLDHKKGTITQTLDPDRKEESVRHKIEHAYNHDAKGFFELLKKKKINLKDKKLELEQKRLRRKMLKILSKVRHYDFTQLLLYKVE